MGLTVLEDFIGGQRIIVVKEGLQRDGVDERKSVVVRELR
jgi:hypothetical protein